MIMCILIKIKAKFIGKVKHKIFIIEQQIMCQFF